jgi:cytosine/adenosine deaminase-related metal-dependent hydrolase
VLYGSKVNTFLSMSRTLYIHATIITVNESNHIVVDGAILVDRKRITAIGKTKELLKSEVGKTATIIDLSGKIIIPGLVNAHAHLAQSLLRGFAEEVPLHSWLCDSIWPLEASYEADDGVIAARLTMAEMLKSGTTCFLEALLPAQSDVDRVCQTVGSMGIRACVVRLRD